MTRVTDMFEAVRAELREMRDIETASAAWDADDDAEAALDTSVEALACRAAELGWKHVPGGVPPGSAGRLQCLGKTLSTVELELFDAGPGTTGRNRFEYRAARVWIGGGALAFCAYDHRLGAQIVTVLGQPVFSEAEAVEAFRKLASRHAPDLEPLVRGGYLALRHEFDPYGLWDRG